MARRPPVHQLFQPDGGGPVPIGSFSRSTPRGIKFRLQTGEATGGEPSTRHFIFQPDGGGPVILGGTGRSRGAPTKITLKGRFIEVDDD